MDLLLATRNRHKILELSSLLADGCRLLSLDDQRDAPAVVEDAATLEGNAQKKAVQTALATGLWCLADDTGLEVDALGKAPGVLSARFAGPQADYEANNRKLLESLKGMPAGRRQAAFRTIMALSSPDGRCVCEEGRLEGVIAEKPVGANGFGYDPLFFIPSLGKTLAQLSLPEKNSISHRAAALRKILPHIRRLMIAALLGLCATEAFAGRTEPGGQTVWDQIMAAQANRSLQQGARYLDSKQYETALHEFSRAVQANPNDPATHLMLGVAYYWNGQVDLSLEEYRKAIALDARNAQAWLLTGISLAWKGEVSGAHEAFKKAAELDPSRPDAQMNLGSIEESLNMMSEALDHVRRAVSLDDKNPLYHFQLAMLYRKLGRDTDSIDSLNGAIHLFPDFEDALLELGAAQERLGERAGALKNFRQAVDLKPRDAAARFRLGRLYLIDGNASRARAVLAEAFHLTPEGEGGGLRLSVSYAGGKKPSSGGAPDKSENPSAPAENPNDPLSVFSRNLERIPLDQSALMEVDVVFVPKPTLVQASAESASSLKRALSKRLADSEGTARAVRRQFELRAAPGPERAAQIKKVLDELRSIMQEAPEGSDTRLGMNLTFTHLTAANARANAETPPKVSYEPRQVGNDLGLWVVGTGWMALVEEVLPESEEASLKDQSDWWSTTGLGYAVIGDGQKARAAFDRAVELDSSSLPALLGRSVSAVMTGDEASAVASLRAALKIAPKNRTAAEGLKWLLRPSTAPKK